jgi:hypothetical protein
VDGNRFAAHLFTHALKYGGPDADGLRIAAISMLLACLLVIGAVWLFNECAKNQAE